MDAQAKRWKDAVDRLWSAPALDFREAAQLMADMTRSEEPGLRDAAAQAMPTLRSACLKDADRRTRELARRRLGAVRDALHAVAVPRFGRRGQVEAPLTTEEQHRRLLGLPLGRRLFGPEIHQAYKRAAKRVHPDAGGSQQEFLELSAARDALMSNL